MNCLYNDGSQTVPVCASIYHIPDQTGTVWLPFTNAVIVRIFQKAKVLQTFSP